MTDFFRIAGLTRWVRAGAMAAGLAGLASAAPALAQSGGTCPPPKKLAAGACVAACPAGFEDQGTVCTYRNQAR